MSTFDNIPVLHCLEHAESQGPSNPHPKHENAVLQ
jgi:hypothetical protein